MILANASVIYLSQCQQLFKADIDGAWRWERRPVEIALRW